MAFRQLLAKAKLPKINMKNKKIIGVIVAANLAVGMSAAFAKEPDQDAQPGSPRTQERQSEAGRDPSSPALPTAPALPSTPGAITDPAGADSASFDKEKFLKDAAQGGMMEINLGKLGTQKGQDPAVKEFAQKLVTDHSKALDELKMIAEKKGITLPTEMAPKHQKMVDHLSSLSGAEFDKAFALHMVKDHKKDIAAFQKASRNHEDAEVSEFATKTLPTLQEHLRIAQQWVPQTNAGTSVEEPAGAEVKQKDDSSQPKDDLNPSKDSKPDYKAPDDASNQSPERQPATPK